KELRDKLVSLFVDYLHLRLSAIHSYKWSLLTVSLAFLGYGRNEGKKWIAWSSNTQEA
ncbi:unnamed protein product, partial [Amoebophrya sp. A25]